MYSAEHFLNAKLLAQSLYSLIHLKASAPRICHVLRSYILVATYHVAVL